MCILAELLLHIMFWFDRYSMDNWIVILEIGMQGLNHSIRISSETL